MIVKLYHDNTSEKELVRICKCLDQDGVMIYPTDSVYAFGCSIRSAKGVEQLKKLCGKDNSALTIVCRDISQIADYCRIDNATFKILKRNLPGPFTFILKASSRIPDKVMAKRKSIGARIPDHKIVSQIVDMLGAPLVTASVKFDDEVEYTTDPELIAEKWGGSVDMVIDGGFGSTTPTAIVDMSDDEVVIIREGEVELN